MKTTQRLTRTRRSPTTYNNDDLVKAINAATDGLSVRKASLKFNIPRTTLATKLRKGESTIKARGPKAGWASFNKIEEQKSSNLQAQGRNVDLHSEFVKVENAVLIPEIELGDIIKKEVEWCIACLGESELSSTPEDVSTYEELLSKSVEDGVQPKFCTKCSKFLEDVRNFKMTCLNSLTRQFDRIFAEPWKLEQPMIEEHTVPEEPQNVTPEKIQKKKKVVKKKVTARKKAMILKEELPIPKRTTDRCNICNIEVSSLLLHIESDHMTVLDPTYSNCTICNKNILTTSSRIHFKHHNNRFDKPKTCEVCGKVFTEIYRYNTHFQGTHLLYECHFCGKKINSKKRMKRHILTKHMSVKCCYHCKEFFYDVEAYKAHMAWEKETRPNISQVCDICGFEAASRVSLHAHRIRQHTAERVPCNTCGKTFKSSLSLAEHNKVVHEKIRYTCEHCGRQLTTKTRLRKHIEYLHGQVTHVECDICGKSLRPSALKAHKSTVHSNVYKFACNICGRAFKQTETLKKHYYSHQKKRPFNCHLCSTGYYMTDYLKKHYLRTHGIDYSLEEVRKVMHKVILDETQMEVDGEDEVEGQISPVDKN